MQLRIRDRARFLAYRIGLRTDRYEWPDTASTWDSGYAAGAWEYMAGLPELARYSLLAGYLQWIGGAPRILEVGCGPGLLRARIEGIPFEHYVGLDPSREAIEQARQRTTDRTEWVCGDVLDLDLAGFDVALCNEVLSVVPDSARLLDRIVEVLSPRGWLLVSTFRYPGDIVEWRLVEERFEILDRVYVRNENPKAPFGWQVACARSRQGR